MDAMEKKRYLTAMGRSVENMTAEELKTVDTAALAKEHAAKATKTREEAERKVRETARQLDYIVRAVRIEELARIKEGFELRIKEDRRRYEEEEVVEQASKAKDQWTADVADKMALGECSVFDYTSTFESMIMSARQIVHVKACEQDDQRAELEAEKGKLNRARSRKEEEIRKAEEARLAAEREEAERRAEEERQRKEEERRARQEELERKERLRMEEQREREAKERMERSQPVNGGGSKGLDSLSSGAGGSSGKYVPPSRRGAAGGDGGGSRWGGAGPSSSDRGGGYGGGRYDGNRAGGGGGGAAPTNSRWS
jgi:translation initiation factor 3 subunit A